MRARELAGLVLIGCLLPAAAWSEEETRTSVAVPPVAASGAAESVKDILTEILTTEVHRLGGIRVVGASDVEKVLDYEAQKQLLGCDTDSCLAEIAGALGVEHLLLAKAGSLGSNLVLNLSLIEMESAKTAARAYETVESEEALIAAARRLVPGLFVEAGLVDASAVTPVEAPPAARTKRRLPVGPMVLGAAGLVGVGLGAGFGARAAERQSFAQENDGSQVDGVQRAIEQAQDNALRANVSYAAGGAAVAGALVWWLVSPRDAGAVTAAPLVGPVTGVALVGRF